MNKKTFSLFVRRRSIRAIVLLAMAVTATLASCSSEDMTDNPVETLPESMYPLTFTATRGEVVASPQTRVSDYDDTADGKHKSKWSTGDQIKVTVSKTGYSATTTCTLNESGTITNYNPKLYWQTTDDYTINAWYSNISGQNNSTMTSNTVSLSNQSSGLAYAMKIEEIKNAKYNTNNGNIALEFKHQLAKVRVKLEKGTTSADLTNATVTIKNQYTDCSIDNTGTVSSKGNANGTITMHKPTTTDGYYEANIVPGTTLATDCIGITVGTNTVFATTPAITTTKDGEMYTFTITVDKPGPLQPVDGVFTVNAGDDVTIKDYDGTAPIVVNGNAKVTIDNVKLNTDGSVLTINNNAQVDLNIKGLNNSFISTNGNGIEIKGGAGLTITGDSKETSKLVVNASSNNPSLWKDLKAGIGPATGSVSIGKISINKVSLNVSGGKCEKYSGGGSAAIGLCSLESAAHQSCTGISITDSKIKAISYGGACIGTGSVSDDVYSGGEYVLGEISIVSSEIEATSNMNSWYLSGACIGFGYIGVDAKGTIDKIFISNSTLNLTTYNSAYKVGRGNQDTNFNATYKITNGISVNGSTATEGWNSDSDKK